MTPATQQWPPWPIEVGQVMASATLELGVQGFEHGDDVSIDVGDVYPYVVWNDTKKGFRDRAEKLGVKL